MKRVSATDRGITTGEPMKPTRQDKSGRLGSALDLNTSHAVRPRNPSSADASATSSSLQIGQRHGRPEKIRRLAQQGGSDASSEQTQRTASGNDGQTTSSVASWLKEARADHIQKLAGDDRVEDALAFSIRPAAKFEDNGRYAEMLVAQGPDLVASAAMDQCARLAASAAGPEAYFGELGAHKAQLLGVVNWHLQDGNVDAALHLAASMAPMFCTRELRDEGDRLLHRLEAHLEAAGPMSAGMLRMGQARLHLAHGRVQEAITACADAAERFHDAKDEGLGRQAMEMHWALAAQQTMEHRLHQSLAQGVDEKTMTNLASAAGAARTPGARASCLEAAACMTYMEGRDGDAVQLFAAAGKLRQSSGHLRDASADEIITSQLTALRDELGHDAYASAVAKGEMFDVDQYLRSCAASALGSGISR